MFHYFLSPLSIFLYFYFIIFITFILINKQISPSKDGLRAQAVNDLAEIKNKKKWGKKNYLINTKL